MNSLDVIIIIPIVWGAISGFRKGLIIEVASLLALILGIYGAIKFSYITANWLNQQLDWSANALQMISFILTFIAIVFVVHLIARAIQKVIKLAALGMLNRIFGSLFGSMKYLMIVSALVYVVNTIDNRYPFVGKDRIENSLLYKPLTEILPFIYPQIEKEIKKQDQSFIA